MFRAYKMVRDAASQCPLPLSSIKDSKLLKYAESILPYSTGIEIEATYDQKKYYSAQLEQIFLKIPNIMSVDIDACELRFRIPEGIKGMICLYEICEKLKEHCLLNMSSGIHYHIDFTDSYKLVNQNYCALNFLKKHEAWVLKSLKSWNYKGKFNRWSFSTSKTAVRYHVVYRTIEFRIGEMSFDYEVLFKRIFHAQNITHRLKASLKSPERTKLTSKLEKTLKRSRFALSSI